MWENFAYEISKGRKSLHRAIITMIEHGRGNLSSLITHRMYGIEKTEDAHYLMGDKTDNLVKVMAHYK